jgi:hypothetical protein
MENLAEFFEGLSLIEIVNNNKIKKLVDYKDYLEIIKNIIKCNGNDFKFDKNGKVICLNKKIYDNVKVVYTIIDKIEKEIGFIPIEELEFILKWDELVYTDAIKEYPYDSHYAILLNNIYFRNPDIFNSELKKCSEIISKNRSYVINIITKGIENYIGKIETSKEGRFYVAELPISSLVSYMICNYNSKKLMNAFYRLIDEAISKYNDRPFILKDFDYNCFIDKVPENINDNIIKFIFDYVALYDNFNSINNDKIKKFFDKICTDYKFSQYWDIIKEKFKNDIKPNYYCFDVTDLFEI